MTQIRPLEGLRVVEMSHMVMGPSTGMFLGFLGAEVIKVEPPKGDKTRDLTGMGAGFFPTFNRGKKSVTLDVKNPEDLAKLHKLIATADVFVENFRDETLAKMSLAPDQLREAYPSLVVASCKGFLQGPYEHRAAMDEVVQMMTGMAYMTGPTGRPLRIGSSANDIMGGLFTAYGVLAALIERGKTGQGTAVRSGLFENCLLLVAQHMVQFDIEGTESPPMPERVFSWPVYDLFPTADGRQIFVGAATDGQWDKLCRGLGLDHLLDDPRLQNRPDQIKARDWTLPQIAEKVAARPFAEMVKVMEENDLLFAPVSRPAEMYDDPHVNRPGGLFTSHYPGKPDFRAPSLPVQMNGLPVVSATVDVPSIGQHNAEILGPLKTEAAE
ncbi:CaiB/BaiF CoA transferase family protein [Pseudoprimorskyibacter insulae]|uniref:Acetyl-CoA:oxalate CoA-transferase n=1 Tax=Pseudoprimorskyibacter insulae TaxID=1695997 RepID=A0A2R8B0C7_9RHOB|nr:CoA transferase [Pseudoprimorskyibacter insulae]SPF81736.1 Acetyl-CoA:oxalate CoA-transferase [Pseudoprimorskyibacter insulae]